MIGEDRINEIVIKAISDELEDIWDFSPEITEKTAYVVKGILELRADLLDAINEQKELIKE